LNGKQIFDTGHVEAFEKLKLDIGNVPHISLFLFCTIIQYNNRKKEWSYD